MGTKNRQIAIGVLVAMLSASANGASKIVRVGEYGDLWPFPTEKAGSLECKILGGGRKAVWLNASATYALNGQAISWMIGADLVGMDGGPVKIGRDHSNNPAGLSKMIQEGLRLCDRNTARHSGAG